MPLFPRAPRLRGVIRALLGAGLLLGSPLAFSSTKIKFVVGPGPKEMSEAEKALTPDPAAGSQHGVILLDETERNENLGFDTRVTRHLRAKIFSAEARSLGDIEIPAGRRRGGLKRWWGWTIHPDGTVRELKEAELQEQEVIRRRGRKFVVLKAALPGIVPGSVIDYGYTILDPGYSPWLRVELQRKWPIHELRFRWIPWEKRGASYLLTRASGLPVQISRDGGSVLVTARRMPAAVEEPWMPPWRDSVAAANLYYLDQRTEPGKYWTRVAGWIDVRRMAFCNEKAIRDAIVSMKIPEGAPLEEKVRRAYDWMAGKLKNTGLLTAEETEAADDEDGKKAGRRTSQEVLAEKGGTDEELKYLFACVASTLGADVRIVLAADRTEHLFDPALLTARQFDAHLVSVRPPGTPDENGAFVDNTVGLPYGEVPWWFTGASAFVTDPEKPRSIKIRPSQPGNNLSETKTRIAFGPGDGTTGIQWSRSATGQNGLIPRLAVRRMAPDEQKKWLDEACGAAADFEVARAEAPDLADLRKGLRLECQGTRIEAPFGAESGSRDFQFVGPWIPEVPELTAPTRVHPVIFPFPRIDRNVIDIEAPSGYEPSPPAPFAPVDSPYGRYALTVATTPGAFHVERMFALTALGVPAGEYDALRKFLAEVHRADRTRLEFRRMEEDR